MKKRIIGILAFLLKGSSVILGLAASPVLQMLPPKYLVLAGVVFALASWLKDGAYLLCDLLDDGALNKSYKLPLLLLIVLLLPVFLVGCDTTAAGVKRFAGLDSKQWSGVLLDAGKGAFGAAVPSYLERRAATGADAGVEVTSGK